MVNKAVKKKNESLMIRFSSPMKSPLWIKKLQKSDSQKKICTCKRRKKNANSTNKAYARFLCTA